MIVKYAYKSESKADRLHLKINKEYIVVSLFFPPDGRRPIVNLISDHDSELTSFDIKLFEVIDSAIPDDWVFSGTDSHYYSLEPKELLGDFWDNYNDGDSQAYEILDDVMRKLHKFHGWPYPEKEDQRKKAVNYFFDEDFDEYAEDEFAIYDKKTEE